MAVLNSQKYAANITELTIVSNSDSVPLHVLVAKPTSEPKAVVQLVHGMCEYKERYLPFIQYLTKEGYLCVIHDHRGHGNSVLKDSDLGYFYKGGYKAMVEDVHKVGEHVKQHYPGKKFFLFGHSMGSMVVRSYTKQYDDTIDGLIVCGSPSFSLGSKFGAAIAKRTEQKKGAYFRSEKIQNLAFGSFGKKFPDGSSANRWICSNRKVVEAYDADPKCNFTFTANGFQNLFELMQDAYARKGWRMNQAELPVWFISGADDPCRINTRKFNKAVKHMKKVGYTKVHSTTYSNMRHEILNEIEKENVWRDIASELRKWQQ